MVDRIPGCTRNNTRKNRRKMFMSTFHLNDRSMDSSVGETPPLARRHSHALRGSKLHSFCLDDSDKDEENKKKNSQRLKTNSVLNVSNTIGACNYMTRNQKKVLASNNPSNISKPNKIKTLVGKTNFEHESSEPPVIIISQNNNTTTEKPPTNAVELKVNVINALKSEKSRQAKSELPERKRRRSCGDMDHIRAKWLLGFNLTMKCRSMSQELITNHVRKQSRNKTSWRNRIESNPEFSERKAKEIEAAAQYFKRRLRILEITSDNSWGMARSSK